MLLGPERKTKGDLVIKQFGLKARLFRSTVVRIDKDWVFGKLVICFQIENLVIVLFVARRAKFIKVRTYLF